MHGAADRTRTALRLRVTTADGRAEERALADGETTIGRDPGCALVIDDPRASRNHARIVVAGGDVSIVDLQSSNGTQVNGRRIGEAELRAGDVVTIGHSRIEVIGDGTPLTLAASSDGMTVVVGRDEGATVMTPERVLPAPERADTRLEDLLRSPVVSERDLVALGMEVKVADGLALGSGLGSFVLADALRVCGATTDQIVVLGNEATPYARYQRLCTNSQIPPHERLRSNSDSEPDNLWGFPGYAVRELRGTLGRGDLKTTASILWSLFGESAIADTYTPRSGDVFDNIAEEMTRIGWDRMLRFGRIRTIRKTAEGRILAVASEGDGPTRRRFAVSAPFVHLSLGYPAIQLLPDLAEYRERTGDRQTVVNAYEAHDHVYEQLRARGGTVILRGRGIVASRVLQRLWEDRHRQERIQVVHLHRSPLGEGHRYGWSQRKVDGEFEFQAFNWPKGCWTGPQRYALEAADPEERKHLLDDWGGTTTANRRDWRRIVRDGLAEGWYRHEFGTVSTVQPGAAGGVMVRIANARSGGGSLDLNADFVIDCTGLVASPERAPVLDDLITTYGLARNPLGRFHVTNDFELPGMAHGSARMYAAGATTLGGPFATVDSFLGLQYAAMRAVNAMVDEGFPGLRHLGGLYSVRQWLRWARRVEP